MEAVINQLSTFNLLSAVVDTSHWHEQSTTDNIVLAFVEYSLSFLVCFVLFCLQA